MNETAALTVAIGTIIVLGFGAGMLIGQVATEISRAIPMPNRKKN